MFYEEYKRKLVSAEEAGKSDSVRGYSGLCIF
jgi:hypothetical protein